MPSSLLSSVATNSNKRWNKTTSKIKSVNFAKTSTPSINLFRMYYLNQTFRICLFVLTAFQLHVLLASPRTRQNTFTWRLKQPRCTEPKRTWGEPRCHLPRHGRAPAQPRAYGRPRPDGSPRIVRVWDVWYFPRILFRWPRMRVCVQGCAEAVPWWTDTDVVQSSAEVLERDTGESTWSEAKEWKGVYHSACGCYIQRSTSKAVFVSFSVVDGSTYIVSVR